MHPIQIVFTKIIVSHINCEVDIADK